MSPVDLSLEWNAELLNLLWDSLLHRWSVEEAQRVIQELKEEIMLEKTTINNLNSQLNKTQKSNSELVSEIDDLLKAAKNVETVQPYVPDDLVKQVENEWSEKVAAKEGEIQKLHFEITRLEARNLQVQKNASVPAGDSSDVLVSGLQNMVRQLQQDVEELEADTIRLTDENTDLQAKLEKHEIQSAESIPSHQSRCIICFEHVLTFIASNLSFWHPYNCWWEIFMKDMLCRHSFV